MTTFVLNTFSQDEEIQTIHLPIVFAAIMDVLEVESSRYSLSSFDLFQSSFISKPISSKPPPLQFAKLYGYSK